MIAVAVLVSVFFLMFFSCFSCFSEDVSFRVAGAQEAWLGTTCSCRSGATFVLLEAFQAGDLKRGGSISL